MRKETVSMMKAIPNIDSRDFDMLYGGQHGGQWLEGYTKLSDQYFSAALSLRVGVPTRSKDETCRYCQSLVPASSSSHHAITCKAQQQCRYDVHDGLRDLYLKMLKGVAKEASTEAQGVFIHKEPDMSKFFPVRHNAPPKTVRKDQLGKDVFDAKGSRIYTKSAEFGDLAIEFTGESRVVILDFVTTHPRTSQQIPNEYGRSANIASTAKSILYTKHRDMSPEDILPMAFETSGFQHWGDYQRFNEILLHMCKQVPGPKSIIPGSSAGKKENISSEGKKLFNETRKGLRQGVSCTLQIGNARALIAYNVLQDNAKPNALPKPMSMRAASSST